MFSIMPMDPPPSLEGWMPPSRENWQRALLFFQFAYPILGSLQWVIKWYGMGKTSVASRLNIPGRVGWLTMESPGVLTLCYVMRTVPRDGGSAASDLPWQNKVLAGLFAIHYAYRAVAFPLLQPSMSPIHPVVWCAAACFQVLNGACLGGWLAAYGPVDDDDWASEPVGRFVVGIAIFYVGLAANFFHDEELREIRRRRRAPPGSRGAAAPVDKFYRIPEAGLFRYLLYPHYLCEWVEWFGFWVAAGWSCAPARAFLVNEIATMLPRAVNGRAWYRDTFGEDKIRNKYIVIPGIL